MSWKLINFSDDFRKKLEDHSRLNLTQFFDEWIYGKGYPKLKVWRRESYTRENEERKRGRQREEREKREEKWEDRSREDAVMIWLSVDYNKVNKKSTLFIKPSIEVFCKYVHCLSTNY